MTSIAVFGLGYVGIVTAACFADLGHDVIGVDVNPDKVAMVEAGQTPVVEERIGDLIAATVESGRLRAATSAAEAVSMTELALVCVGTPSAPSGGIFLEHLARVAAEIGSALRERGERYTVAIRSTVLPGTLE